MKREHPLAELYAAEIKRVREGDIEAARKMMQHCANALREQFSDGRNNLAGQHATYLAEILERLSENDSTARLFCLGMPKHRPRQAEDSSIHLERAKKILTEFQRGGTLLAAMEAVANAERKSLGAVRASWEMKGSTAEITLLVTTPKSARSGLRLPGAWR
jgi:hypothetical protein